MKANELMIGDWVNFLIDIEGGDTENDPQNEVYQPMQVDSISSLDEVSSAFYGVTNDAAQLRPIPLTAEILEKNGFIGGEYKSYTGYVWYLEEKGFRKIWFIMSCEKSILWGEKIKPNGSFSIPNIKFVHELQHAMRLCNINKEIEI